MKTLIKNGRIVTAAAADDYVVRQGGTVRTGKNAVELRRRNLWWVNAL
jgi:hypothetical protein